MADVLTGELIVSAYLQGAFPMADGRDDHEVHWYSPDPRGVIPLDRLHVPRTLQRIIRQDRFEVRLDTAFDEVVQGCAAPRPSEGGETWINDRIAEVFGQLYRAGLAHSIECWRDGELAGGLYGLALGGAFFGESMFHHADPAIGTHASNVALVATVEHLRARGYALFDVQFTNPHLERFGAEEIPRDRYMTLLSRAVRAKTSWR